MAFAIGEVGIERDATQVLFDAPPIIKDRHLEGGPTTAFELAITNDPCVVDYAVDQDKAFLKIHMEQLDIAQVNLIETLMATSGPIVVKLKVGDATTITCAFGPREMHKFVPYNKDYPDGDKTGATLTPVLTAYKITLFLLRLE